MYHLFKVYARLKEVMTSHQEYPLSLVRPHQFFGMFEVAILTPFVGERDADETDMENETLMQQVAVYWLAEHGILYIDIRPASIRIGNDAVTAYLIDYDGCVLLKQPLHTAAAVLENLRCNAHAAKWISLYPVR